MIVVTGATGQLGRLVIEGLLESVPAGEIVAAVRDPAKASAMSERGVQVRRADYAQPETLTAALAGADKVLLISSNEVGQRHAHHQAVIDAAKSAGASLLAYTSILRADTSALKLAADHKTTEAAIRASGIPFVMLRNGWYYENQTGQLGPALEHGAILGASGDGRYASATRADYAAAAVAALTGSGHGNAVYELAGDEPYTMTELAAEVARESGRPVAYSDMTEADYKRALMGFGLPEPFADLIADSSAGARRGELDSDSHDLAGLIGRPTTPLPDAVYEALRS